MNPIIEILTKIYTASDFFAFSEEFEELEKEKAECNQLINE